MPINTKHSDYTRMVDRWCRCRAVADGQDAVHAGGEAYLPKLKDQSQQDYEAYKGRALFYNATWRTIAGLVGMIFRKEPVITVPAAVKPLLDDVTLTGVPFQMFAQDVVEETLKIGRVGILVEFPQVNAPNLTLLDAKNLNLRPFMVTYRAESVINWKIARVNNAMVLVQLVIKELVDVPIDEYAVKSEERFRVLDLIEGKYRQRVFKVENEREVQIGEDVFPTMNSKNLDYIPFTFLSTDDNGATPDEPPLIDLVNVNLSHYRSSADLEHGAHFTGLPTPWISGYKPEKDGEKLYIGSTTAWVFPDSGAKAEFLEFKGEGLKALTALLAAKEAQMAVLGARMLEPQKRGVEAADTVSTHRKGEESMLAAAAQAISLGLTRALTWFSEWAGATGEATCELNDDFYPTMMSPQMLTALVAAWQQGGISFQTLFYNLQYGDVIDADKTPEEEQAQIGDTPPNLQGQNVDPVTGEQKSVVTKKKPPAAPDVNKPQSD